MSTAFFLPGSTVVLRVDLGVETGEADPPNWLDAPTLGRGRPGSVSPADWLPREASPDVYDRICAYGYNYVGDRASEIWWSQASFLARGAAKVARSETGGFGRPSDWIVAPRIWTFSWCRYCRKTTSQYEGAYEGRRVTWCACGEPAVLSFDRPH